MTDNVPADGFDFPAAVEGIDRIPAQFRPLYTQGENGEFKLFPDLVKRMDHSGYANALTKERQQRREWERKAKEREGLINTIASAVGAADETELPARVQEIANKASPNAADSLRMEIEQTFKQTYGARLKQSEAETDRLRRALQSNMIDRETVEAIAAAKGSPKLLAPHIRGVMKLVEEHGELCARVVDQAGEVRYRPDGQPMTAQDLVSEMKRDPEFAMGFESSGNSGSGAVMRGSGSSGMGSGRLTKTYTKDEWRAAMAKAKPDDRAQLMREQAAGKIKVND